MMGRQSRQMDDAIPDHSTFSKTRTRKWQQSGLFQNAFYEIVKQCIACGLIQRINEEFMGEFTDADRVIVEDLYNRMKKDEDVQRAAQTDDQQVYHRSVFPGIFDETAMAAYMENQEAYIQLFQDAKKYHAVQAALADMLYRDLHDKKN